MAVSGAHAPMVVTYEGGRKFAAQVRSHRIITDQPARSGGDDTGPSPTELLGVALGSCIALYVQQYCETRGLPYAGMRVEIEQHGAPNPSRIGDFAARVILPEELPPHHREMLERVARSCPVHNTLHLGAKLDVQIEVEMAAAR